MAKVCIGHSVATLFAVPLQGSIDYSRLGARRPITDAVWCRLQIAAVAAPSSLFMFALVLPGSARRGSG